MKTGAFEIGDSVVFYKVSSEEGWKKVGRVDYNFSVGDVVTVIASSIDSLKVSFEGVDSMWIPIESFKSVDLKQSCHDSIMALAKGHYCESIMALAKERYKLGTTFNSALHSERIFTVLSDSYHWYGLDSITVNYLNGPTIYKDGEWAKIISTGATKFEIGDWFTILDTPNVRSYFGEMAIGKTLQIRDDADTLVRFYEGSSVILDKSNIYSINYKLGDIRLATQEEIPNYGKIFKFNVGDFVQVITTGCGCGDLERDRIVQIKQLGLYDDSPGYIVSPKIGNSESGAYSGFIGEESFKLAPPIVTKVKKIEPIFKIGDFVEIINLMNYDGLPKLSGIIGHQGEITRITTFRSSLMYTLSPGCIGTSWLGSNLKKISKIIKSPEVQQAYPIPVLPREWEVDAPCIPKKSSMSPKPIFIFVKKL